MKADSEAFREGANGASERRAQIFLKSSTCAVVLRYASLSKVIRAGGREGKKNVSAKTARCTDYLSMALVRQTSSSHVFPKQARLNNYLFVIPAHTNKPSWTGL